MSEPEQENSRGRRLEDFDALEQRIFELELETDLLKVHHEQHKRSLYETESLKTNASETGSDVTRQTVGCLKELGRLAELANAFKEFFENVFELF